MPYEDTVYLDFNATTPIAPEVADAMRPYLEEHFGNPSSSHVYGSRARRALERSRERVAALVDCEPDEIYFTGSATEANNLALRGALGPTDGGVHIVLSAVEHPAVDQTCRMLEGRGVEVTRVPVDERGLVSADAVVDAVREETQIVSIMHANNVVGSLQPVAEIGEALDGAEVIFHTDAAQSVGKLPVSVADLGVDLLSIAGHKLYAPKGVGALYVREEIEVEPVLFGASQEGGLRPGTENIPHVVGFGEACRYARRRLDERRVHMETLRNRLWEGLEEEIEGLRLNGPGGEDDRLPNTLNVTIPDVDATVLLGEADEVAASTGSACHEGGESEPSGVLTAMGRAPAEARGAVRLSVGETTTAGEIDRAVDALVAAWREIAGKT